MLQFLLIYSFSILAFGNELNKMCTLISLIHYDIISNNLNCFFLSLFCFSHFKIEITPTDNTQKYTFLMRQCTRTHK